MKKTISLILLTLLAVNTQAYWVKNVVTTKNMFLMCSSSTGTDGDVLFEIPVQIDLVESKWAGTQVFTGSDETYITFEFSIDEKLTEVFFGDVTDVSPLSTETVLQIRKNINDQFDLTLDNGYRIVLPNRIQNVADAIYTADSFQSDIGLSVCALSESTYNSRIADSEK